MSTASLLRWIALVAGAELAVRGDLADRFWACHAGAALVAIAFAALTWPTRAGRAGAIAAAALFAIAAIDAALEFAAAPPTPPAASQPARLSRPEFPLPTAPAPGSFVILVFAGRNADGQSALPAAMLGAALRALDCDEPLGVVEAGVRGPLGDSAALEAALARFHPGLVLVIAANELLDDVIAEQPALDFPAAHAIGPRGSRLGRAIEEVFSQWVRERRWQRALAAELELDPRRSRVVARYRELVLAARRADADVMLLIPPLALAPASDPDRIRSAEVDAPRARAWQLASRAHARSIRALAGSYAIPAIDTQPGLRAVADALAPRLARTPPACRPALR